MQVIGKHMLETVETSIYFGSNINGNLSLDNELDLRKDKEDTTMTHFEKKKIWTNSLPTTCTKIKVYRACVHGALFYEYDK